MHLGRYQRTILTLGFLLTAVVLRAQDAAAPDTGKADAVKPAEAAKIEADKKDSAPALHKVAKETLKAEIELEGVFEADQTTEVLLRPEVWADLSVMEAVAHGKRVERGEALVVLDMQKIDEAIHDADTALHLAELAARQAAEDLRLAQQSRPLDLAKAERAAMIAQEDLKRFNEIDRVMSERGAEIGFKLAGQMLEYQTEELRQLEKMYKADEVTEETEEIILKRTRNDVESAKFSFEQAKIHRDEALKVTLPRKQDEVQRAAAAAAIELDRARVTMPIAMRQKEIATAKAKHELEDAADKLKKLKADRASMRIVAPTSGVVYYGRSTKGKWTGGAEALAILRRGGKLPANEVFMTIVGLDAPSIRTAITEKQIGALKTDMTARVVPTAFADTTATATLVSLSPIPVAIGGIEASASFKLASALPGVAAGMTCKVTVITAQKANALAVPSAAVFTDDADPTKRYVLVADKGGKPQRRDVKVGVKTDSKTEVVEGLSEGDQVFTKKPGE